MKTPVVLLTTLILFIWLHCADMAKLLHQAGIENPKVRITKARLSSLSFEKADLVFDIKIENPNQIGINLSGFDYDLLLNHQSFLKGDQKKEIEIKSQGNATLELPLTLDYANIYKTYQGLREEDEVGYTLNSGLSFNLPVLGPLRIPVSASGKVPMVRLPAISLKSIKLSQLTLRGADFDLTIGVNNPNSWGIIVNALQYGLSINGTNWINGQSEDKINLASKGESTIHLPFSISFLELGSSIYKVVANGQGLNYRLRGQGDLSSSLELLGDFKLPFDVSGKVDLSK